MRDAAIDAIAPLFQRDENYSFLVIKKSFENWTPPIKTQEDAEYFLNKIVAKNVQQYISSLYKKADPFFAKILDSINYIIRREGLLKVNYFGQVYIVELKNSEITRQPIDKEQFENIPINIFNDYKNLFKNLFQYLNNETKFYPAIPLNSLIYKIKHLNISNNQLPDSDEDKGLSLEISEKVKVGLNFSIEKLYSSYLKKNKLNKYETEIFEKALVDISVDLLNGGINPGLYPYLKKHFENLSHENFDKNYHNILEYLIRVMKRTIADEIVRD